MDEDFKSVGEVKKMGQIEEQFELLERTILDCASIVEKLGVVISPVMYQDVPESCEKEGKPEEPLCDVASRTREARERLSETNEVLRRFNRNIQL